MKRLLKIAAIASALSANAQIGYQVSLLDNATGEPRADETVTVEIAITDSMERPSALNASPLSQTTSACYPSP